MSWASPFGRGSGLGQLTASSAFGLSLSPGCSRRTKGACPRWALGHKQPPSTEVWSWTPEAVEALSSVRITKEKHDSSGNGFENLYIYDPQIKRV